MFTGLPTAYFTCSRKKLMHFRQCIRRTDHPNAPVRRQDEFAMPIASVVVRLAFGALVHEASVAVRAVHGEA
jgi:hypothetical protein